jgi:hypothetical protein
MTLAKRTFFLSSAVLLAGAMGVAQTAMGGSSQDQDSSTAGQAAGAKLRGCLSGSSGNYTLTDHNGAIYHLVGGEARLQDAVGHEVEVTGTPSAQRSGASDDMASNTASSFEVTGARQVGARCDHGASSTGTMDNNSRPMDERPPTTDRQPKGAPGEGTPPEPHPQLISMLQQPGSTDMGNATSPSSTMNSPASPSSTSQNPQTMGTTDNATPGTPPPVTSETPAASQSPTNPNAQMGAGTASQTGTSTAAGTSAAGQTSTSGTEGATGTSATNPGAANPSAASPGTAATTPSTQNDANKPLYERQATDVPWANHSGSTTTSTPTTPQQPEPHL